MIWKRLVDPFNKEPLVDSHTGDIYLKALQYDAMFPCEHDDDSDDTKGTKNNNRNSFLFIKIVKISQMLFRNDDDNICPTYASLVCVLGASPIFVV